MGFSYKDAASYKLSATKIYIPPYGNIDRYTKSPSSEAFRLNRQEYQLVKVPGYRNAHKCYSYFQVLFVDYL